MNGPSQSVALGAPPDRVDAPEANRRRPQALGASVGAESVEGPARGGVAMIVAELIEQLKQYPSELPVRSEGCDCEGDAKGTVYKVDDEDGTGYVLVTRGKRTS